MDVKLIRRSHRIVYRFEFYMFHFVEICMFTSKDLSVMCQNPLYYACQFFEKKKFTVSSAKWFDIFILCHNELKLFFHFIPVHIYDSFFFISWASKITPFFICFITACIINSDVVKNCETNCKKGSRIVDCIDLSNVLKYFGSKILNYHILRAAYLKYVFFLHRCSRFLFADVLAQ